MKAIIYARVSTNDQDTTRQIDDIKEAYPPHNHHVELEAFASAEKYTASEITSYIKTLCRKP